MHLQRQLLTMLVPNGAFRKSLCFDGWTLVDAVRLLQ